MGFLFDRSAVFLIGSALMVLVTDTDAVMCAKCPDCPDCPKWTPWIDRDDPSGSGDFETFDPPYLNRSAICVSGKLPIDIECDVERSRKIWYLLPYTIRDDYNCNLKNGIGCFNRDQGQNYCPDYRVRFLCPA